MEQKKYNVFISYSRKDATIANQISNAFDEASISYFIDRNGILSGQDFVNVIIKAIRESSIFLFLASQNSYASSITIDEVFEALDGVASGNILFITYIIDKSELPIDLRFRLRRYNWRTLEEHPVNSVLIPDIMELLNKTSNAESLSPVHASCEHSIGEIMTLGKQKGIVFYLDESRQHGKIVSSDSSIKQWCSTNEYLAHRDTMSISDDEGMANLKRIQKIPSWELLYPAFKWCAKKGDAWYLPTIEDYRMIDKQRDVVFEKISGIDEKGWFWSSEQESVYSAKYYHFLSRQAHGLGKDNACIVLAVAEF